MSDEEDDYVLNDKKFTITIGEQGRSGMSFWEMVRMSERLDEADLTFTISVDAEVAERRAGEA